MQLCPAAVATRIDTFSKGPWEPQEGEIPFKYGLWEPMSCNFGRCHYRRALGQVLKTRFSSLVMQQCLQIDS